MRLAAAVLALTLSPAATAIENLTYTLTPVPESGRLRVELSWNTGKRQRSVLGVSQQWGAIENVAALLKDVQFAGASATRVPFRFSRPRTSRPAKADSSRRTRRRSTNGPMQCITVAWPRAA